jgi:hypothetical protein
MRAVAALMCGICMLVQVRLAEAATISVKEYPDGFVVEIDGSMDAKLPTSKQADSVPSTHMAQPVMVKKQAVKPVPEDKEVTAAYTLPEMSSLPGQETFSSTYAATSESVPATGIAATTPVTATVSTPSRGQVVQNPEITPQNQQYNRGQTAMDYMAKMPKRSDFVEGRLETRQARWSKRQAQADLNSTE